MVNKDWLENPTGKVPKSTMCPTCARYNAREVACHALVVRGGEVLMIKRNNDPMRGWWALPGGYLGWDETAEECAARELTEELGLKGEVVKLLGVYSDPKRDEDGRQNVALTYIMDVEGEAEGSDEVIELRWFKFSELPKEIAFDHRQMIEDYKEKYGR